MIGNNQRHVAIVVHPAAQRSDARIGVEQRRQASRPRARISLGRIVRPGARENGAHCATSGGSGFEVPAHGLIRWRYRRPRHASNRCLQASHRGAFRPGPTKGSPRASSSAPGAFAGHDQSACSSPTPNTVSLQVCEAAGRARSNGRLSSVQSMRAMPAARPPATWSRRAGARSAGCIGPVGRAAHSRLARSRHRRVLSRDAASKPSPPEQFPARNHSWRLKKARLAAGGRGIVVMPQTHLAGSMASYSRRPQRWTGVPREKSAARRLHARFHRCSSDRLP